MAEDKIEGMVNTGREKMTKQNLMINQVVSARLYHSFYFVFGHRYRRSFSACYLGLGHQLVCFHGLAHQLACFHDLAHQLVCHVGLFCHLFSSCLYHFFYFVPEFNMPETSTPGCKELEKQTY
jgi:hypothetical protein